MSHDISLCGLAMLGVIVDRAMAGATVLELIDAVPYHPQIDELPGELEAWPHGVSEWFDELQTLLDRGLVERKERERDYAYHATSAGEFRLRAALHPRGRSMRSVA